MNNKIHKYILLIFIIRMFENNFYLIEQYNILINNYYFDIKYLTYQQLLNIQHCYERFNIQVEQMFVFNYYQYNKLIEYQQFEQNQLKHYQKLERILIFKWYANIKEIQRLRYYQINYQINVNIDIIYQNLEYINFLKNEINKNIILFLQTKNIRFQFS